VSLLQLRVTEDVGGSSGAMIGVDVKVLQGSLQRYIGNILGDALNTEV
jgi:hypothetical protein